ncbi:hypothetical protein PAHAL_6G185100 [Panicum hallii]|uniref:Uncharacterized protein n=1 Tax=Panicum hallii TaxID=206008 RepID=A0A2T8IGP7_9POAL|nr:hypothetical protein PAHAL_6G185100 [Panicum hallii]
MSPSLRNARTRTSHFVPISLHPCTSSDLVTAGQQPRLAAPASDLRQASGQGAMCCFGGRAAPADQQLQVRERRRSLLRRAREPCTPSAGEPLRLATGRATAWEPLRRTSSWLISHTSPAAGC